MVPVYKDEMADFAEGIGSGKQFRVGIADGREALKIGLAARESIARGAPVPVRKG